MGAVLIALSGQFICGGLDIGAVEFPGPDQLDHERAEHAFRDVAGYHVGTIAELQHPRHAIYGAMPGVAFVTILS